MKKIIRNIYRSLNRNRAFLFINIIGLAIGLAVSLMLLLFVATELSYDRHFVNRDRIVQLNTVWHEDGQRSIDPICLRYAYADLPSKIPGIESAVQIYRGWNVELAREKERFQNIDLLYADPEFFNIFRMDFVSGNPLSAIKEPNTAVITNSLAERIFGSHVAVGKTFSIHDQLFTVTAVVNKLPTNTHFSFDVLASMKSLPFLDNLEGLEFFTYYLLRSDISQTETCKSINKVYAATLKERFGEFDIKFESITQKLTDIYLHSKADFSLGPKGSIVSVLILAGLAIIILLLAITNFVNLFIVQGDKRALEVGIRKTIGGSMKNIAAQFFSEASVIVLMAFSVGVFLAVAFMKLFSSLIHKSVEPSLIFSPLFILGIFCLILITVLLSASYPAFYLSRFRPAEVLKKARKSSKRKFTTSIAIFQSVITIVLIAVILVVNKQLNYLQGIPKGYNAENVIVLSVGNDQIASHYEALRRDLEKLPKVQMVSAAQHTIGGGTSGQGIHLLGSNDQSVKSINEYRILPGLCELMKFELTEGTYFGDNDSINRYSLIINEAAAKMLGISGSAVGKKAVMFEDPMEIIGVVRNFYYDSPAKAVQPIALTSYQNYPNNIYVRFDPILQKNQAAQMMLPVFQQFDSEYIMNPRWCDDIYESKFWKEKSLSDIVVSSTVLSLIIALLGLFAIHSYTASRRTKEIGIRKVFGSKSWSIIYLLSNDMIKLIAIAGIISFPISYFIARTWLENYANRTDISWLLLLLPVMVQGVFAALATFMVSIRISNKNPVEALRYE